MRSARKSLLPVVTTLCVLLSASAHAQSGLDTSPAGSARLIFNLDGDASRLGSGSLTATFAPFVTSNLQFGVGVDGSRATWPTRSATHQGSLQAYANYYLGTNRRSRPFAGVFASVYGGTGQTSVTQRGFQVGWLQFLSPASALRLEYRYRQNSESRYLQRYILLYLDPYIGGRANSSPNATRGLGTVDFFVRGYLDPTQDGQINGDVLVAPFLTRWLQLGASGNYARWNDGLHAYQLEGFGRLYYPSEAWLAPYVGTFAEAGDYANDRPGLSSWGPMVGLRANISREVAIDGGWRETRHPAHTRQTSTGPVELRGFTERGFTVRVITQLQLSRSR